MAEFDKELFYNIDPSNWYKTYPFAFEVIDPNEGLICRFFLPIPPQNYTIQDMSTSEAHATIGGVVEEINSPVFSMITLVGTTGLAINSPGLGDGTGAELTVSGRKILDEVTGATTPLGKVLNFAKSTASNIIDSFTETEQSLPYQNAISAVNTPLPKTITSLFQNADVKVDGFLEKLKATVDAFNEGAKVPQNEFTNGWAWSQALRQFFLIYQRERSQNTNLQLYFSDYKSRATYRCVPRSVQFQQNANAPYLINYTIILKCWELEDALTDPTYNVKDINRFNGDLSEVMTTSITGVVSKVGKIANSLNRLPSVAGSFLRNSTGSFL